MRPSGVSLIELLVCLLVGTVLAAAAMPSLSDLATKSRAASASNHLLSLLNQARSEAVMRRRTTSVCPSRDGLSCFATQDWSPGLLSWVDDNDNGQREEGERVLRVMDGADLHGQRLQGAAGRTNLGFRADGRAAGRNATLKLCGQDGTLSRRIIINNGGRVRIEAAAGFEACIA